MRLFSEKKRVSFSITLIFTMRFYIEYSMTEMPSNTDIKPIKRRSGDLAPDLELWNALKRGPGLTEILKHFYTRVFQDTRLAPFFEGVTLSRVIEKQHAFMQDIFSGSRMYFGERPRNAHSWMVISDELFDYREDLLEESMREYGLAEHLIKRWRAADEIFRKQIVKSKPVGRKIRGKELPVEGYGEMTLECGGICDGCDCILEAGNTVRYHLRTGKTYCIKCIHQDDVVTNQL